MARAFSAQYNPLPAARQSNDLNYGESRGDTMSIDRQPSAGEPARTSAAIAAAVLLASLGYFVDTYDLILFSIVRVESLRSLGVSGDELLAQGVRLLNMQMGGMLIGGFLWGILGDKKGRLSVLVGSILLYSVANAANGLVTSVSAYAWLRFVAGIGLAGELGAGVTLVSELMPAATRGWGTMLIAGVGILGGAAAGVVGHVFAWRTSYFVGGALGLVLLALRFSAHESGMFGRMKDSTVPRGEFRTIFASRARATKFFACVLAGVPIWLVFGILVTFSPELGRALGVAPLPDPATAMTLCCVGCGLGDFVSGGLSQYFSTRKQIVRAFLVLMAVLVAVDLLSPRMSLTRFYGLVFGLGVATGYWAVFMAMAAEQFGTNVRATVTTTVPNLVRGANVPMNLSFVAAKSRWGVLPAAGGVGVVVLGLAAFALTRLEETFGKPLDYCED